MTIRRLARTGRDRRERTRRNRQAALLVDPCDWLCEGVPLGVEPLDSELGVDLSGFLGLKKPMTPSASCVKRSFLGVVVLVVVSGVTL